VAYPEKEAIENNPDLNQFPVTPLDSALWLIEASSVNKLFRNTLLSNSRTRQARDSGNLQVQKKKELIGPVRNAMAL